MSKSWFINIEPANENLSAYINSFTFSTGNGNYPLTYTAFPNVGTCLAFFNKTTVSIDQSGLVLSSSATDAPAITLLGRLTKPTLVTFKDPVEEISITFKPSGINYFFDRPFAEMAPAPHQLLTDPQWTAFAPSLYAELPQNRIALLEAFLLSKMVKHKEDLLRRITNSIAGIEQSNIEDLAGIACMSQRNFLRHFKNYMGCSPSTYKKIVRFKKLLDTHFSTRTVSYEGLLPTSDYYDSAHFRKDFVEFTGIAPSRFVNGSFLQGNGSSIFKTG